MAELSTKESKPETSELRRLIGIMRVRWSKTTHDGAMVHVLCDAVEHLLTAADRFASPTTDDFLESTRNEAAHQVAHWGVAHDVGKAPEDFIFLTGFLIGKGAQALKAGDREKALHHTISSAAVLLNWHAKISGENDAFRPGIEPPAKVSNG